MIHTYIHTYIHTHIHIEYDILTYIHTHKCIHTYTHIQYIHIYIHTRTPTRAPRHTYTRTQTWEHRDRRYCPLPPDGALVPGRPNLSGSSVSRSQPGNAHQSQVKHKRGRVDSFNGQPHTYTQVTYITYTASHGVILLYS